MERQSVLSIRTADAAKALQN